MPTTDETSSGTRVTIDDSGEGGDPAYELGFTLHRGMIGVDPTVFVVVNNPAMELTAQDILDIADHIDNETLDMATLVRLIRAKAKAKYIADTT